MITCAPLCSGPAKPRFLAEQAILVSIYTDPSTNRAVRRGSGHHPHQGRTGLDHGVRCQDADAEHVVRQDAGAGGLRPRRVRPFLAPEMPSPARRRLRRVDARAAAPAPPPPPAAPSEESPGRRTAAPPGGAPARRAAPPRRRNSLPETRSTRDRQPFGTLPRPRTAPAARRPAVNPVRVRIRREPVGVNAD